MQNFSEKFAKIHQKDSFLRIQDSFLKRDLSASPIDGLTQNINCCTCKTHGFHKNFPFREFSQKNLRNFASFSLYLFSRKMRNFARNLAKCDQKCSHFSRNVSFFGNRVMINKWSWIKF